jgi:hypothetical protein
MYGQMGVERFGSTCVVGDDVRVDGSLIGGIYCICASELFGVTIGEDHANSGFHSWIIVTGIGVFVKQRIATLQFVKWVAVQTSQIRAIPCALPCRCVCVCVCKCITLAPMCVRASVCE